MSLGRYSSPQHCLGNLICLKFSFQSKQNGIPIYPVYSQSKHQSIQCIQPCQPMHSAQPFFQMVCVQTNLNTIPKISVHLSISANRNPLIKCIEVVIIKNQTNQQSFDNKGQQLFTVAVPLLLNVAFNKLLIDITTDKRNRLFFKILQLTSNFFALSLNLSSNFFLRYHHNLLNISSIVILPVVLK